MAGAGRWPFPSCGTGRASGGRRWQRGGDEQHDQDDQREDEDRDAQQFAW